ncbi:hypothetical protein QYF36_005451 [Acer negundo]|nr:hypothetical protein QYF36_005451 [Acer negundo]
MGCLTAQVFRFSAGFSKSNDEKFRQLLEAVTKKLEIQVDLNESEQDLRWPDAKENGAKKRSYMSIGLGKIGRINEDKPCYFADDTVIQIATMTHDREELPLEFPNCTTPVSYRVSIYDGSTDEKVGVGSLIAKAGTLPLLLGSLYMEEMHVKEVKCHEQIVDGREWILEITTAECCSTVLLPAKVVQALNLNFKDIHSHVQAQRRFNGDTGIGPNYDALMVRRNALLMLQKRSLRANPAINHHHHEQLHLPQDWTY